MEQILLSNLEDILHSQDGGERKLDPSGATTHIHSINTEYKHFHTKADLELCGDHHPGPEK